MSQFETLTPQQWIVDCRSPQLFNQLHIKFSTNIPASALFERMHELPVKEQLLIIIVDKECYELAKTFFSERSFKIKDYLFWEQIHSQLPLEDLEQGASNYRLWQPAPIVKDLVDIYLPKLDLRDNLCLDLACGSGRDAMHMALNGFQVTAIDYSPTALERCRHSAKLLNLDIEIQCIDLEKKQDAPLPIKNENFDIIIVCRYLHRPLFESLKNWLVPGGVIAYHTFMRGAEKIGSPRNPDFLLEKGELSSLFSEFSVLADDIVCLDDGRPMSYFIAQKANVK